MVSVIIAGDVGDEVLWLCIDFWSEIIVEFDDLDEEGFSFWDTSTCLLTRFLLAASLMASNLSLYSLYFSASSCYEWD